jgi:hypothetical protein
VRARHVTRSVTLTSVALAVAVLGAAGAGADTVSPSRAACAAMSADVHRVTHPTSGLSLVTPSEREVAGSAARLGLADDGVVFRAATRPDDGLVPVHRLWSPTARDFVIAASTGDMNRAVRLGYVDQGASFYAAPKPLACSVPVYRYVKGVKHRIAVSDADRAALEADGWRSEGPRFWAMTAESTPEPPTVPRPPDPDPEPGGDTTFTLAVMPDTQQEVFGGNRLTNRAQWLVDNRDELDLRFVVHTGDVVNWDTPDHVQYENASASLRVLDDAGIPLAMAIGNHDTNATGEGGAARPGLDARQEVRNTATFNRYFPTTRLKPEGTWEEGKVDNAYQLFSAGGEDWMLLSLELWPRPEAVQWAQDVVAAHADRNVIVVTHSYLEADGTIRQDGSYGATSPQALYDSLISVHPNIRIVLSGHTGTSAHRVDTGADGNTVVSLLGGFHSPASNHVRLLEIDTAADTLTTRIFSPIDALSFPLWDASFPDMQFD